MVLKGSGVEDTGEGGWETMNCMGKGKEMSQLIFSGAKGCSNRVEFILPRICKGGREREREA